jgi:cytochrome c peroxidase
LRNPIEMGGTTASVHAHVLAAYRSDWAAVFGEPPTDPGRTLAQAGKALDAFERTQAARASRFDRYAAALVAGEDTDLLTGPEKRGLDLFVSDAGCFNCHHGPMLTDGSFHNLGLPQVAAGGVDPGRARGAPEVLADPLNCHGAYSDTVDCPELRYLDPGFPDWPAAFKTPTLRNVALTAPYMHDGSLPTLDAVLNFYNHLPGEPLVGHRELTLASLRLDDADRDALVAFLATLTQEEWPEP